MQDYDRVVSGSADGTADVLAVTESDGSTAYGTGYVVDLNNDGARLIRLQDLLIVALIVII